jgi:hypothetical protein
MEEEDVRSEGREKKEKEKGGEKKKRKGRE